MKDLLKLKSSLSEEMENILNEQVKVEAYASSLYLAMSSWCDEKGLDNAAEFFAKQSDEEREHMLKLFRFINDRGGRAISPEVINIPTEFDSFRGVFEQALEQEIFVTQQFNEMSAKCMELKDFTTFSFLKWFLDEQVGEEYVMRRILDLFDVIGEEATGRWEIDRQLVKVSYDE